MAITPLKYGQDFTDFTLFKSYKQIAVIGPQRSGTHFFAKVVSNETGYEYLKESVIYSEEEQTYGSLNNFLHLCRTETKWVLQATDLMVKIDEIPDNGFLLVVVMIRPIKDILRSQSMIKWVFEKQVKEYYANKYPHTDLNGPIAEVRYRIWDNIQRQQMNCDYIEIDYDSLSNHPMWVPYDQRPKRRRNHRAGKVWNAEADSQT